MHVTQTTDPGSMQSCESARALWQLANHATDIDPERSIIAFDAAEHEAEVNAKPWQYNPTYFSAVWISALALLKIAVHAHSGGIHEVLGLLQGRMCGRALIVTDAFALPVEGTETRVNASAEANEYIVAYTEAQQTALGKPDVVIGWYHSHPGYGCWLSGIDVATQRLNQQHDPFVAVVIDPLKTDSTGAVECCLKNCSKISNRSLWPCLREATTVSPTQIKAFRCFPEGFDDAADGYALTPSGSLATPAAQEINLPANKSMDYGAHSRSYYHLPMRVYKTTADEAALAGLWRRQWVSRLLWHSSNSKEKKVNLQEIGKQMEILATKFTKEQTTRKQPFNKILIDQMEKAYHEIYALQMAELLTKVRHQTKRSVAEEERHLLSVCHIEYTERSRASFIEERIEQTDAFFDVVGSMQRWYHGIAPRKLMRL